MVIPAHDEAATIAHVAAGALAMCSDVIVVDDGSTDGTGDALGQLAVQVIRHAENRGKAAALGTGFAAALAGGAEVVVTLDADGQHRPEDIPRLLASAAAYPDCIVIGARLADPTTIPKARYRANRVASFWISWAAGQWIEDTQSGFRVYPRRVLERVAAHLGTRDGFVFESEILIEAARRGFEVCSVPIPALYDPGRRPSHFRPVADVTAIVRMVAWKLLKRGMDPGALWRALRQRRAGNASNARLV